MRRRQATPVMTEPDIDLQRFSEEADLEAFDSTDPLLSQEQYNNNNDFDYYDDHRPFWINFMRSSKGNDDDDSLKSLSFFPRNYNSRRRMILAAACFFFFLIFSQVVSQGELFVFVYSLICGLQVTRKGRDDE